jgi:hypothetical protein
VPLCDAAPYPLELALIDDGDVSCYWIIGNNWHAAAVAAAAAAAGIDSEVSYNYTAGTSGKPSNCSRHWPPTSPVRIQDFINIPSDETGAMRAFATSHGPFAVGLDAAGPAWKHYLGGVLRSCCNLAQEHAPTVVGWGTEVEGDHIGGQYWCVHYTRMHVH